MRTGTENLSANSTALPNRASIACLYFSSQAGLPGTAGGRRSGRSRRPRRRGTTGGAFQDFRVDGLVPGGAGGVSGLLELQQRVDGLPRPDHVVGSAGLGDRAEGRAACGLPDYGISRYARSPDWSCDRGLAGTPRSCCPDFNHSSLGGRGCARVYHQVSCLVVSWPLMMDALWAGWADKAAIACALGCPGGLVLGASQPSPAPWITRGQRHRSR
jgi:hypothetical protein